MLRRVFLLCGMCGALMMTNSFAADNEKTAYLKPEDGGADFRIQGEYVGKIGKEQILGAQVIALGGGKFDAVLYAGGLPGAGWDEKTKVFLKGETKDGATQFRGRNFTGTIADDVFSGSAEDGVAYELRKLNRESPTLGAAPPQDAVVLFDGKANDLWETAKIEEENLLGVEARTKKKFGDFKLHIEFRTPFMPNARGQARGNSGVYMLDQYECQVLDSFGLDGEDNECGGIYKVARPKFNMAFPPLSWQTYDIDFQAAKFDDSGKKTANAVATIQHNGVVIHDKLELPAATPGGRQNDEKPGALFLQNHGDPVRYRNIWIIEK